jgi:hypothetical protein
VFELNVTIPIGSKADVVLPARLLGVDPHAKTTRVTESDLPVVTTVDATGDLVAEVGSGSYSFVLSAAAV